MKWSNDGSGMTLRDKVTVAASLAIIVIFMWLITGEFHQLSGRTESEKVLLTDGTAWHAADYDTISASELEGRGWRLSDDPVVRREGPGVLGIPTDNLVVFLESPVINGTPVDLKLGDGREYRIGELIAFWEAGHAE